MISNSMHISNNNKRRSWKRIRSSRPFSKISNERKMSRTKSLLTSWKSKNWNEREIKNQIKLKWPKLSTPTWGYMVATQIRRPRSLLRRTTTTPIVHKLIGWTLHHQYGHTSMRYWSDLKQRTRTGWFRITRDLTKPMRRNEPLSTSGRCGTSWPTTGQSMSARPLSMRKIGFWLWFWGSSTGTTTSLHLPSPNPNKSPTDTLGKSPRTTTTLLRLTGTRTTMPKCRDQTTSSGRTWTSRPKSGTTTPGRRTPEAIDKLFIHYDCIVFY